MRTEAAPMGAECVRWRKRIQMMTTDYSEIGKLISRGDEFQDLYFLFALARYTAFRDREKELLKRGLSPEQAQVLFVAQVLGNRCTPTEMARILVRQPHTISAIINRMVKKGFIKKVEDMEQKNWVRVVVTEKGKKPQRSPGKEIQYRGYWES